MYDGSDSRDAEHSTLSIITLFLILFICRFKKVTIIFCIKGFGKSDILCTFVPRKANVL